MAGFFRFLFVVLAHSAVVIFVKAETKTVTAKKPIPLYRLTETSRVQTLNNGENTSSSEHIESQGVPLKEGEEAPVPKRIGSKNLQAPLQQIEVVLYRTDGLIRGEAIRQAAAVDKGYGREFLDQKNGNKKDRQVHDVYEEESGLNAPRLIACYDIAGRHTGEKFCSTSCFIKDMLPFEMEAYFLAGCSDDIHPTGFEYEGYIRVYYCNESLCNKQSAYWPWKVISARDS